VMCLKLIKSGQVVHSQRLKSHFMNMAKEIQIYTKDQAQDPKKLEKVKAKVDSLVKGGDTREPEDILRYFRKLEKKYNKGKEREEEDLIKEFEELTTYRPDEYSDEAAHTSIMQKALKSLMQEFWSQVIPMQCPHCQGKSPGFRKDGNTKIFQRPLSEKARNAMIQEGRLRGAKEEDVVDTTTIASSRKFSGITGGTSDRLESAHSDAEEEDEDMADEIASGQQKMLTV